MLRAAVVSALPQIMGRAGVVLELGPPALGHLAEMIVQLAPGAVGVGYYEVEIG